MNKYGKYYICILFAFIFCINSFIFTSFSLSVASDSIGIYCTKDNGMRARNEWVTIDFEGDYFLEYYYFDNDGYLIMNRITPDGYIVNEKGQWIENGIVQRLPYTLPKNSSNSTETKSLIQSSRIKLDNIYFLLFTFLLIVFIYIIILLITKPHHPRKYHNTHYNKNSRYSTDQNDYSSKTTTHKTTINDTTIQRDFWWNFRSDTDKKGDEGEDEVAYILKDLDSNFIVLRNINLPRKNKEDVQIDFICVSSKGIFVIEVKNWIGFVTGDYESEIWHSTINDTSNKQKNPLKQNEWHIEVLKRFIKQNINFYSIVVFTRRSDLSYLSNHYNKSYLINTDQLKDLIYAIFNNNNSVPYNGYKRIAGYLKGYEK